MHYVRGISCDSWEGQITPRRDKQRTGLPNTFLQFPVFDIHQLFYTWTPRGPNRAPLRCPKSASIKVGPRSATNPP